MAMNRELLQWKYFLRPLTTRMNPNLLYMLIRLYSWPAYNLTNLLNRIPYGSRIVQQYIPFRNHRRHKSFEGKDDAFFIEYGIHDTFDSLSPKYDNPINPDVMESIAKRNLKQPFEIERLATITLLRTLLERKDNG